MGERKLDRSLSVRTMGIREWQGGEVHYNRYEATPYAALDKLFEIYRLDSKRYMPDK